MAVSFKLNNNFGFAPLSFSTVSKSVSPVSLFSYHLLLHVSRPVMFPPFHLNFSLIPPKSLMLLFVQVMPIQVNLLFQVTFICVNMFVQEILVPVDLFVQVMFDKVELMLVVRLSNVIPRKTVCSNINFCSKSSLFQ